MAEQKLPETVIEVQTIIYRIHDVPQWLYHQSDKGTKLEGGTVIDGTFDSETGRYLLITRQVSRDTNRDYVKGHQGEVR